MASYSESKFFFLSILSAVAACSGYADVIDVPPGGDIQAAINSVSVGGTVNLEAGNYPLTAQLVINKNLTLNGAGLDVSIIQSPDTVDLTMTFNYTGASPKTYTPIIIVENASDVILQNFTVDGRDQSVVGVVPNFTGVGYHNTTGTISNLHVHNILESTEPRGYQEGMAILNANDTGTNTITIQNCVVDDFQKAGIQAIGAGLTFDISQNTVTGMVGLNEANPNGIEAYDGATGVISNNTLNDLLNPSSQSSSGILVFNGPGVVIENNTINATDNGIYLYDCDNSSVNGNVVENGFFNITIDDTGAATANTYSLSGNTISNDTSLAPTPTYGVILYSPPAANINPIVSFDSNIFDSSTYGLMVNGNTTDTAGPIVTMHNDKFLETAANSTYYIQMVTCPNDIWPSTYTVSFNGLVSGAMTIAQFDGLVTNPITQQIYDKNTDPTLGLVLSYVPIASPTLLSLNPGSGPDTGDTVVTLTGTGFTAGAQVYFGGVLATDIDVISSTTILATSPPGTGTVPITVTTPNGTSPVVPTGNFTYIGQSSTLLPPLNFVGTIKKSAFLNKTEYQLTAKWSPSPSPDVAAYRIYKNGKVVEEISATSPYIFKACLKSRKDVNYEITAVSSSGLESSSVKLKISE